MYLANFVAICCASLIAVSLNLAGVWATGYFYREAITITIQVNLVIGNTYGVFKREMQLGRFPTLRGKELVQQVMAVAFPPILAGSCTVIFQQAVFPVSLKSIVVCSHL